MTSKGNAIGWDRIGVQRFRLRRIAAGQRTVRIVAKSRFAAKQAHALGVGASVVAA